MHDTENIVSNKCVFLVPYEKVLIDGSKFSKQNRSKNAICALLKCAGNIRSFLSSQYPSRRSLLTGQSASWRLNSIRLAPKGVLKIWSIHLSITKLMILQN